MIMFQFQSNTYIVSIISGIQPPNPKYIDYEMTLIATIISINYRKGIQLSNIESNSCFTFCNITTFQSKYQK